MRRLNDLPSLSPCLVVPKSVAPKTRVTNEEEARSDKHHIKEARRGRATASFCSGSFIFLLRERKRCKKEHGRLYFSIVRETKNIEGEEEDEKRDDRVITKKRPVSIFSFPEIF